MRIQLARFLKITTLLMLLTGSSLMLACQSQPKEAIETNTLSEVDIQGGKNANAKVFVKPKSKEEIRQAYLDYLNSASASEETRLNALTRLAELEYNEGSKLNTDNAEAQQAQADAIENRLYQQRLERTIELLSTSLRDFPEAKGNDSLLYQLAKAQAQNGQHNESVESLNLLVEKYPQSSYYVEAQFRIAEDAFSIQDYSAAEYAYGEVILSLNNETYYENSLFKRGWARFKQRFYSDAIDDFIQSVLNHEFGAFETLTAAEKEQFNEYFRAIALSFSYQNDTEELAEYFKNRPDFGYTYHTYRMIAELYEKQERYTDAVESHQQFIEHFPKSDNIPYSYLKIIEIWKTSGFEDQIYQAIEDFYSAYNPASLYWVDQNENSKINRVVRRSLREYLVLMSGYYHNRYQSSRKNNDLNNADKWYRRYLEFYESYAQQDKIFFLYGELFTQIGKTDKALGYYEKAAFDNELILHKEAVYAAIVSSDKLFSSSQDEAYLAKVLTYTQRFSREYPDDKRSYQLAVHAAEQAFHTKQYKTTIELADLALASKKQTSDTYPDELRATAYYSLQEFKEAESIYQQLIQSGIKDAKKRQQYQDGLALSIYRQGENALKNNDMKTAIALFTRISTIVPNTETGATGLYDAIALYMQASQWDAAIASIEKFQQLYPKHKYHTDVSKKLSVAYLNSDQGVKAAQEFEKLARTDSDYDVKAAALWKAAELYEAENKSNDAIKAYQDYAKNFRKPYTQRLEAMYKVAQLHQSNKADRPSRDWYQKIIKADEKALNNARTEQSRVITSTAYLALARHEHTRFDKIKLTLPLKNSLTKKKAAMQNAVKLFGKASVNKNYEITTEATYSIASIYKDFSQSLLASDRPDNLNQEELDQYEILLEDQAFPFEDKSIEFFEINLSRVKEGLYNNWIQQSHKQLIGLFPVRYNRQPKLDEYIATLQ